MKFFLSFTILVGSLLAVDKPLHVELNLYKNKTILKKIFDINSTSSLNLNLPPYITLKDIKIDSTCSIKNYAISNKIPFENSQKERDIYFEIDRLKTKNSLLRSIKIDGENSIEKVEKILDNLTENLKKITLLEEELKKLKSDDRFLNEYKKLHLKYACDDNGVLSISFPLNSIRQSDFYNLFANSSQKTLTVEKFSKLFYKGVEDLIDIDINFYSYAFNQRVKPKKFYPNYIGEAKKAISKLSVKKVFQYDSTASINNQTYNQTISKSFYNLKNQTLLSNKNTLFNLDKKIYDAHFQTYIDAYGSNRAYIEVAFKADRKFARGIANFYLDDNPITTRYIQDIQKTTLSKLYFGEDEQIEIKKELIKTLSDKTFFGDKTIQTQNWKYTITNTKPYSTTINFVHKVPVSKDPNIKVEVFSEPKYSTLSPNGKIEWKFKLEGNRQKEIIFGYEIKKEI